MTLHTHRSIIQSVIKRFAYQYPENCILYDGRHSNAILESLRRLDLDTCTAQDVERVIGNDCWIRPPKCSECSQENVAVLEVGEPQDYVSHTAYLCKRCCQKALNMWPEDVK